MIDRLVPIADDLEMAGALAERVRSTALALYGFGAADREPGRGSSWPTRSSSSGSSADGELLLIDEVMTPDSTPLLGCRRRTSRAEPRRSFDKQFVRDYLETQPWDKTRARARAAGRRRGRHPPALRRGLRADHRGQLQRYLDEDVIAR